MNPPAALRSGRTIVVHDFVSMDLAFDDAVAAFARQATTELIEQLLIEAWLAELNAVGAGCPDGVPRSDPKVVVELGPTRNRSDTTFFPLRWESCGGTWLAPLDADLEIIRFGPDRTHLHVLGISRPPPDGVAAPPVVHRTKRLTEAFVRHFLTALADQLMAGTEPRRRR